MKKLLKFHLIKNTREFTPSTGYPSPTVFDRIVRRFPEIANDRLTSVEVVMEESDPKLAAILQFLENECGLRGVRTNSLYPKMNQNDDTWFTIDTKFEFDTHDIENATFLTMIADVEMGLDGRDGKAWDQWGLVRAARKMPLIGCLGTLRVVCTAAVREELEKEHFVGLYFRPIIVHDPRHQQRDFWRIWANRSMPKVAMRLCDMNGDPVRADYSTGCIQDEIAGSVLQYNARDLGAMHGTDFALTAEKWGPPQARYHGEWLVVSQRFRQWCLKKGVKADWTPVIEVPD